MNIKSKQIKPFQFKRKSTQHQVESNSNQIKSNHIKANQIKSNQHRHHINSNPNQINLESQ